jgi:hypothetical protein
VSRPPSSSGSRTSSGKCEIAFAETLVLERIAASIGSFGDAYDNALAETTIRSTGKTTDAYTAGSTTSHPTNTKPPTTLIT